jgi:hypothetical protein
VNDDTSDDGEYISINDQLVPISSLRLTHKRGGEAIAHREVGSIPQASDAAILPDGTCSRTFAERQHRARGRRFPCVGR